MGGKDDAKQGAPDAPTWMTELLLSVGGMKAQLNDLFKIKESVDGLRSDMNGRFKKLEHAVFGDEDNEKVGLTEKSRTCDKCNSIILGDQAEGILPIGERVRNLESGWAKLTTIAVLACTVLVKLLEWLYNTISTALASGMKTH